MKFKENFKLVFNRYGMYRSSRIGLNLIKVLINLYKKNKIRTYFIFKILSKFDEANNLIFIYMHILLQKRIFSVTRLRGFREEYRNIEDIWYFTISEMNFFMDINKNLGGCLRIEAYCELCHIMLIEKN